MQARAEVDTVVMPFIPSKRRALLAYTPTPPTLVPGRPGGLGFYNGGALKILVDAKRRPVWPFSSDLVMDRGWSLLHRLMIAAASMESLEEVTYEAAVVYRLF
jgi:hypothetical protein